MCVLHVCQCTTGISAHEGQKRAVVTGNEAINGCEWPRRCWELNLSPWQEHHGGISLAHTQLLRVGSGIEHRSSDVIVSTFAHWAISVLCGLLSFPPSLAHAASPVFPLVSKLMASYSTTRWPVLTHQPYLPAHESLPCRSADLPSFYPNFADSTQS